MKTCSRCTFFRNMTDIKLGHVCDKKIKESNFQDWQKINPDDKACPDFKLKKDFNPIASDDDFVED